MGSYREWAEELLGTSLPGVPTVENNFSGAIEQDASYGYFRSALRARLLRLRDRFIENAKSYQTILHKVAQLSSGNADGAFSELAAYDFLSTFTSMVPEVTPPAPLFGSLDGKQPSTLDGCLPQCSNLHFDVKRLADVPSEVVRGIEDEIRKKHEVHLRAEFDYDSERSQVVKHRGSIISTIEGAILSGSSYVRYEAARINFRIYFKKPGITITEHAYNPYTQAKNLRYVLIDKGYQFLLAESNLRIYVVHPWFNHINYTSFLGSNSTFFRSLARRGFCQLTKDSTPIANAIASGWTSRPVSEAACRLSAVLFLVDCTVEKKHEKADVREARDVFSAYLYLNPNSFAENRGKLELGRFVDRADKVLTEFDDFDSDNY